MNTSNEVTNNNQSPQDHQSRLQLFVMCGSLLGINLGLMIFVGMYWLHPTFHALLAGKPL